jgi:predicted nucleic acid-binding protein
MREDDMTRFVIGPDVALMLAEGRVPIPSRHTLLAPTLLRSQVLAHLYSETQSGLLSRQEADDRLDYIRRLQIRLLGDRVLQRTAWEFAERLKLKDTFVAEYLALTKLQADALVVRDVDLREAARAWVPVATPEEMLS